MNVGNPAEVEGIRDKDRGDLLRELLKLLSEAFGEGLVTVAVFGSVARGESKPTSDTDILVIAENMPRSMSERMEALAGILMRLEASEACRRLRERGISTWVQFHPLMVDEARLHRPIYLDMVEDAVILHDRGGFFRSILNGLRGRLEELGARRVRLGDGSWLWDLKPDIKRGEVVEI
ncbi:nucleotidyltransferase domain-containing protein [Candidatus Bathyarchaeota archaeon]|nr:nucleotidyltransferase domain-containing protein [Candidatus Bathyarchaeota archaeon]